MADQTTEPSGEHNKPPAQEPGSSQRAAPNPSTEGTNSGDAFDPLPEVVQGIVQEAAEQAAERAIEVTYTRIYTSPLPPAAELDALERTQSGLIDTTVGMIRDEQQHRRELERAELNARIQLAHRGQIIAGGFSAIVLVAAVTIILTGHTVVGLVTLLGSLAPILYAFLSPTPGRPKDPRPYDDADDDD